MARFLGGLNEDIAGFIVMFPYRTLQDLVDQAKHTERKIQQEARGRSYGNHSIAAPWHKHQSSTSFGEVGLKVLLRGPLQPMFRQRWRFLQHHLLQISSDLLRIQQPKLIHQVLHLLLGVEKLCATNAMDVDILLLNVRVEEL
jgi:hypothetical protein